MPTIQNYKKMLAYLIDNGKAKDYADIARKSGVNEAQISRVRKGRVKSVKEETMQQVNNAYGRIFNPDWWRGDSDVMLIAELAKDKEKVDTTCTTKQAPDMSSMINAIIAANDQAIMALKREVAAKEETIAALREQLADRDETIKSKQAHINTLEHDLYELRLEKGLSTGRHHPTGVAESDSIHPRP